MKGLGPWDSFGVGSKSEVPPPPPPPDYAQMIRDMAIRDLIAEARKEALNLGQTSSEQRR